MEPQFTVLIEGDADKVASAKETLSAAGLSILEAEQDRGIAEAAVGAITWLIKLTMGSKEVIGALLEATKQPTVSIRVKVGAKVIEVDGAHQADAIALLERIHAMASDEDEDD